MPLYDNLKEFIAEDMVMSHVYQPVMLIELLRRNGKASTTQIAEAILRQDPTQVEYYEQVVKTMVGRVLTRNRHITLKQGDSYILPEMAGLSVQEKSELIAMLEQKLSEYKSMRGNLLSEHRRRGHRPISGSIRFEVLKRARFRCELCGEQDGVKSLEVDHVHRRSLGGKDTLDNYQALCYTCNAAKGSKDKTDFRDYREIYAHRESGCPFCEIPQSRVVDENELALVIRDGFPITPMHTLIIPKRHVVDYFGLFQPEINATNRLIIRQKELLQDDDPSIDGFNIGINCGETAGQTVFHCHIHLIPRRKGDIKNPRGGIRNLILTNVPH